MVVQYMVTIYAMLVRGNVRTIEELPEEYRQLVQEQIERQ